MGDERLGKVSLSQHVSVESMVNSTSAGPVRVMKARSLFPYAPRDTTHSLEFAPAVMLISEQEAPEHVGPELDALTASLLVPFRISVALDPQ